MECKFCKEQIQDNAIKCKYCGELQNQTSYQSKPVVAKAPSGFGCYTYALKNYFNFSGRARRREYWIFILFNLIISFVLGFIDAMMGTFSVEAGIGMLGGIYTLAILIPSIAITVRRLHDTERSGWWVLISLVPLVGFIVLLVFMCLDSKPGKNKFGLIRKAVTA